MTCLTLKVWKSKEDEIDILGSKSGKSIQLVLGYPLIPPSKQNLMLKPKKIFRTTRLS